MTLAALRVLVPSALLAATPATPLPAINPSAPETRIESYVTQAMEAWKVPGVAIAVVKDDKVGRGPFSRQIRPESHLEAAGFGWMLRDWHGRLLVWNTGGMDGMSSSVGLLPEENLGIIVLTNGGRTSLPEALVAWLLDVYTGKAETDWSAKRLQASLAFRQRQATARQAQEAARVRDTKPTLPLARYAGTYAQPLLGELTVAEQKGRLVVRLAGWEGEAEHWHLDTFRVKWSDPERGTARLTFQLDAEGAPTRLMVEDWGEFQRRG